MSLLLGFKKSIECICITPSISYVQLLVDLCILLKFNTRPNSSVTIHYHRSIRFCSKQDV